MVEKTSAVGANSYSSANAGTNTSKTQKKSKPNSIHTKENDVGQQSIKPVPKPKPQRITITVGEGQSLGYLAAKYNTTVSDIIKLNGLKNPDNLKLGQKLQINAIDSKQLKAYEEYKAELFEQKWQQEKKEKLQQKIETSKSQVQKAKEYGYDEDSSFKVDKNGNAIVTLKTEKELGEVRRDFQIPAGSLSNTNDIKGKYKPKKIFDLDNCVRYNNYDKAEVPAGDSLLIEGAHFRPDEDRTSWDRFWGNII